MRCLLFLFVLAACLAPPRGIEQPTEEETPAGEDGIGIAGEGTGTLFIDPNINLCPSGDCDEITDNGDTGDETTDDGTTDDETIDDGTTDNDTDDNDTSLPYQPPVSSPKENLPDIVAHAVCNNCLLPADNATELSCEVTGCRDGFSFLTSTAMPRTSHRQKLCKDDDKTMRHLASMKFKCTFKQVKKWWFDGKEEAEIYLSKAIVRAGSLCVVTYDNSLQRDVIYPQLHIEAKSCTDSSVLRSRKHKLAITFSW